MNLLKIKDVSFYHKLFYSRSNSTNWTTGPTGATGPAGSNANTVSCFCVDQMRNVIQQLITLYLDDNVIIAMESGNKTSGRLGSLLPMSHCFDYDY